MSVDLPALGNPTSATSAMSLSSMSSQRSWPFSPCSAKAGARRRLERKRALPRPPWPPSATMKRVAVARQVAHHRARRGRARPSRPGPAPRCPCPGRRGVFCPTRAPPSVARRKGWSRKPRSEDSLTEATSQTSPAVAAVAAVGAAAVDVGLAPPRDRAGAAVARPRVQLGLIDEAGHSGASLRGREEPARRARRPTSARARSLSIVRAAARLDHAARRPPRRRSRGRPPRPTPGDPAARRR